MKSEDLVHLRVPESPTLSPDGRTAIFGLRSIDIDSDRYVSQLWRVSTDGTGAPSRFTQGDADSTPRFSPDGRWLAFRRGVDGVSQLFVMPADGGESWPVTTEEHHPLGVDTPVWSPDSSQVAYVARCPEPGRYGTAAGVGLGRERPRRISDLKYRREGLGYMLDRPGQVYMVDPFAAAAGPRRLTDGGFDNTSVSWSPDGQHLAFASARNPDRDRTMTSEVFVMGADGSGPRQLTTTRSSCDRPVFSTDGCHVFYTAMDLGPEGVDWFARHTGVFMVPVDGSAPPVRLSDAERYTLDGHFGAGRGGVLFGSQRRGEVELLHFQPDREPITLIGGRRQVSAACPAADVLVAVVADPTTAGDLVCVDAAGERPLTSYGAMLAERADVRPMRELTCVAPDGYPVHGWVVKPPGRGPHPVLLMIHGGPFAQYGWTLFDEAQVYAGAGYAVVMGNPRGSSGYGYAHGRYVAGDVGARSAPDLIALLDHALSDDELDTERVGVLGGSHGGYMVGWLLSHTTRFRAGVSERSINAIDSFIATADSGWAFTSLYGQSHEDHVRQSPLTYADRVTAPLLIIHAEDDLRSPFEQGQRYFHALRSRGAEVELLVFPAGGHELSRSGLPSHRTARFEAIVSWFGRHL